MKNINTTHENGVALIFALGLLTLMSVLGVAFVTNSLTAQKTAVNIGAKNQAQILMDSAVNRIMISLMGIMQQAPGGANDYSTIYSTAVAGKKGASNTTWDQLDGYSGYSPANKLENSKLSTASGEGLPEYDGSKSNANWIYIKDKDGYVIGRMAYQVLPVGRSSMSLDQVLLGIYNHDKTDSTNLGKPGTSSVQYPWNVRIGKDIREFNIGKAFATGDAPFRLEWKYDGSEEPSNPYYKAQFPGDIYNGEGYSQNEPFRAVESFEKFFAGLMFQNIIAQTDAEKREQQINWFKHWFNESKNAYREVFLVAGDNNTKMENAEPFFRFNLSDRSVTSGDKWYSRFNNADKKNSEDVVKELLGPAEPWIEMKTSPKTGIPYLAQIAKDPGSFGDIEKRRRQIAANLNDYCDEDSIPTSNVPAAEWHWTDDQSKLPQYTGNEKTPYINEFVLGVKLENFKSSFGSDPKSSITFDLTPKFYTELIDIYGGATSDYNVKSWFNKLTYEIDVTAKVKVTFEDDPEPLTVEGVIAKLPKKDEEPEKNELLKEGNFSSETSKDVNGTDKIVFTNGYGVAVNELNDAKISAKFEIEEADLKAKMTADNKNKVIKNRELVSYKVTVKKVTLGLAAVGLFSTTGTKPGVDFVKGPASEIVAAVGSPDDIVFELDKTNQPITAITPKDWDTFYLSGMEVRDPRQNLNFTKSQKGESFKADASDWKCVPKLQARLGKNDSSIKGDNEVGSIIIESKENNTKIAFAGKVNSCSNPNLPFDTSVDVDDAYDLVDGNKIKGTAGVDYDKENATDPAWLGEHGSLVTDEKHLSTAFIRNAPMQSLWELGVIHRAAAWQTINLKRAVVSNGGTPRRINLTDFKDKTDGASTTTAYVDGDAVLLDQVKLTEDMKSSGKLDVNMLFEDPASYNLPANWNKNIAKALFYNISIGQQVGDLYDSTKIGSTGTRFSNWGADDLNRVAEFLTNKTKDSSTPQDGEIASVIPNGRNEEKYISRADFIEGPYDPAATGIDKYPRTLACGFGLVTYDNWANKSDAQQEEIIGKTANLITVGSTPQTSINAIVVVQTIKPIKVDQETVVVKEFYKKNGKKVARGDVTVPGKTLEPNIDLPALKISADDDDKSFKFGRFTDSDGKVNFIYWDEITSELRALVTIKEHTDSDGSTRFQLSNIKYLGN